MYPGYLRELLENEAFRDRLQIDGFDKAVDVIIPIQNTNSFFARNLVSIYRELPVNRLIIGNGGCEDDGLEILAEFPRVLILDHTKLETLGGSIVSLVSKVETDFFAYLHSDVYLPKGFYEKFIKLDLENSWVETNRNSLVVHEDADDEYFYSERPYSGAQFGDSKLLQGALVGIEDDYLYRNEDLIIKELVREKDGKYFKVKDLRHLHQSMTKNLSNEPALKVSITRRPDPVWEIKTTLMQYRGIIKYTEPVNGKEVSYLVDHVNSSLLALKELGALDWPEVKRWVLATNPEWLGYIKRPTRFILVLSRAIRFITRWNPFRRL